MCTCRNLLTSLSRLPSSIGLSPLSLLPFSLFSFPLFHVSRPPPWPPMSAVVNCQIYRFWIWAPASQGNLSASPRNLALITAIYPSPPSMTFPQIRVIETPRRLENSLTLPRFAEKSFRWERWMILFVTSIRENCFPPNQFCAGFKWRKVRNIWLKIHMRVPSNFSVTSRDIIRIHSPRQTHSHWNSHVISIATVDFPKTSSSLVFKRAYSWCKHRLDYGTIILCGVARTGNCCADVLSTRVGKRKQQHERAKKAGSTRYLYCLRLVLGRERESFINRNSAQPRWINLQSVCIPLSSYVFSTLPPTSL